MKINIKGQEVSYIKKGSSNNKILLLHGWGCNKEIFTGITDFLSGFAEVYALDFPGFGESSEPKSVWGVNEYTNLVIEFIEKMNIKSLSILGHSFGGRVIINLANQNKLSFKIKKIVLMGSAGIRHQINKKKSKKQKFYKFVFPIIKKISPKLLNYLKSKVGSTDYKNATPMMRDILVKTIHEDLKELIKNINYSTLIIWGENDCETPFEDALYIESQIKDCGIVKIKNGSHYAFLEQPGIVNKALKSFLEE